MPPARISASELASVLPSGGLTLVSSCSAESDLLADAVMQAGLALGDMTVCGIFVPGLNRKTWLPGSQGRVLTFFMTPELRRAGRAVEFLPLCYDDILSLLRKRRPDAALFMTSTPNADGRCSFGTAVDFIADLWRDIPIRIAHLNSLMPHTPGHQGIPYTDLTAVLEGDQALYGVADEASDATTAAIARYVSELIPDSATIQTGLGKIPGAVLRSLTAHRDLRLHTGLVGDAVLDLVQAGALRPGASITAGVAIGSTRLYEAVLDPIFDFQPVSKTHSLQAMAGKGPMISINSAIEVDLYGQAHSELTPRGFLSGPGGASDFTRAIRDIGGLRIVALPSTASQDRISRIVPAGSAAGPVSLGRMDIDYVVTEYGVADLRYKSHDDRAKALTAIAHPLHRDVVAESWSDTSNLR